MPNNKKRNKQKKKGGGSGAASSAAASRSGGDANNARVLEALRRLAETLANLDETSDNDVAPGNAVDDEAADLVGDASAMKLDDGGGSAEAPGAPGEAVDGGAADDFAKSEKSEEETAATTTSDSDGDGAAEAPGSEVDAAGDRDGPPPSAAAPERPLTLSPPGLPLSHWRTLPLSVSSAYDILNDGAEYIHATSTKYTLVGKVDSKEGGSLALELRKGAELIGTAALLFFGKSCGSSRSLRRYVKQSSRSVLSSVVSLMQSFEDGISQGKARDGNNVGAQKTGAVWAACDGLTKSLPRGNRAAMRRELMLWARDCNESIEEFEEVLALGPLDDGGGAEEDAMADEDQYTEEEIAVARASVNVMKCSKNLLGLVLKTCECVGERADMLLQENEGEQAVELGETPTKQCDRQEDTARKLQNQRTNDRRREMLQYISNLHEMGRTVGEGVTNFGILLYPPLDASKNREELEKWQAKIPANTDATADDHCAIPRLGSTTLGLQLEHQLHALSDCVGSVHEARLSESGESVRDCLSEEVADATAKLRNAVRVRCKEVAEAIAVWDRDG